MSVLEYRHTQSALHFIGYIRYIGFVFALCVVSAAFAADVTGDMTAQSGTLKDPTAPPASPTQIEPSSEQDTTSINAQEQPLKLQMIVRGPGESLTAIVNGKALHVGSQLDALGGVVHVVRITPNALMLRQGDDTIKTIELLPDTALQAVRCKQTIGTRTSPCLNGHIPMLEKNQ